MTLPSQFSLEEENFYKDIQDLVKNGSQNEKELSLFLQRYMDLLSKADLDEENFIINFTKAGLIIEASAKVYGNKVDELWTNLEHLLDTLKNKNQGQSSSKKSDCEDGDDLDLDAVCDDEEEGKKKMPHSRKKKKIGDPLYSIDDFVEIDNSIGLLERNINESSTKKSKLKMLDPIPSIFIKLKKKKKKMDICLNKCMEDRETIRVRDWVVNRKGKLVRDIFSPDFDESSSSGEDEAKSGSCNEQALDGERNEVLERVDVEPMQESHEMSENLRNGKNNNADKVVDLKQSLKEPSACEDIGLEENNDSINDLNISRESDVAKFPNILDRLSEDCLVDVDEVYWNSSKFQDVIPSKKMRAGKTNKPLCQLCTDKKVHKKKGKRCIEEKKLGSLDSYFAPHVQPTITEPQFGILPDEELHSVFKTEMKLIEQLGKVNTCKNINEAYHPDKDTEKVQDFLGFDGLEQSLIKRTNEMQEDEIPEENLRLGNLEDDNEDYMEDPLPNNQFELPIPVTENTIGTSITIRENDPGPKDDENLANPESEYQKLVMEELKDHYAAKTSFAKNKELGMKISKWHEKIADKIKLSEERGALNMNSLTKEIMDAFPPSDESTKPTMSFRDLVKGQSSRDVPRYFFACLQLANEGNLDISRSVSDPLATDCMNITQLRPARANYEMEESTAEENLDISRSVSDPPATDCMNITQLRSARANYELEESTEKTPSKGTYSSKTLPPTNKKRKSLKRSPSIMESKSIIKNKKLKQNIIKSYKRPKNFNSVSNSKRQKCSISSADSPLSE